MGPLTVPNKLQKIKGHSLQSEGDFVLIWPGLRWLENLHLHKSFVVFCFTLRSTDDLCWMRRRSMFTFYCAAVRVTQSISKSSLFLSYCTLVPPPSSFSSRLDFSCFLVSLSLLCVQIADLESEDGKNDTMVDVVFKKALKEFRINIFNSYSTALAVSPHFMFSLSYQISMLIIN